MTYIGQLVKSCGFRLLLFADWSLSFWQIKKSALAAEMTNAKGSAQAGGGMKGHLAKGAANILGSPDAKT